MNGIISEVIKNIEDLEKKFGGDPQSKNFEEASKKFEELVERGYATKRGNHLPTTAEVTLKQGTVYSNI